MPGIPGPLSLSSAMECAVRIDSRGRFGAVRNWSALRSRRDTQGIKR